MAYKDIQHFMKALERKKQLKHIQTEVNPILEITEIADRMVKRKGPALLFENVKGSPYPLLINAFGSYERMSMALGAQTLDAIGEDIKDLIDFSNYMKLPDQIKSIPRLARLLAVFPIKIKKAPCQEVVEEPDLNKLPILKCWPDDGGRFITLPLVFTKDPETGQQNVGMYRMQVYDHKTTGMHWHLHKDGREIYDKYRKIGGKMPITVVIGCDPATVYAATAPLPKMIDEIMFAGYLRKRPVPLVKSITNNIYIPANSEFVLEGYVDTEELRVEGPFGDHTGYYSEKDIYPVFHITKMTRKQNPVFMATIVGKPPMEDCYMGKATERLFLPLLKMIAPEIVDINFPLEGVFHNCVIVSIKKKYPAHAKKIMNTLWGSGQMMYTKMIIVVDASVNPHDVSTVAWKVFNNIDAKRDVVISEGPLDALDHASPMHLIGHRLGIDATKKWASEGYEREWPDDIVMSQSIKKKVSQRWKEYGF
ncbi:MAG: menaquinone biosynthesis decarboxylase [Clostridia bacterium]|jgi:4-hydroxy-3-polyprenylbenzoate decarboxylase|nr:menaquinone biosynthesis decarboxylase [Clostridia bacterium]